MIIETTEGTAPEQKPVVHRRNHKIGGTICGAERGPGEKVRGSWKSTTCPACLAMQGQPVPDSKDQAKPEQERADAPQNHTTFKSPGDPALTPLANLLGLVPTVACARAGRDPAKVRKAFGPGVDPIDLWCQQAAVVLDGYLGNIAEHPVAALVSSSVMLGMAIMRTPPEAPPKREEPERTFDVRPEPVVSPDAPGPSV